MLNSYFLIHNYGNSISLTMISVSTVQVFRNGRMNEHILDHVTSAHVQWSMIVLVSVCEVIGL